MWGMTLKRWAVLFIAITIATSAVIAVAGGLLAP